MHTSTELRSEHFEITVGDGPGSVETLFPGFGEHDRLGIVIGRDWGAAGASTVILTAVTAFYDRLRARSPGFLAYPDFFAFHVDRWRGSLHMLDVYPEHKEVVVPGDPEQILEAINDRGITRLLVEEHCPAQEPEFEPYTRASAERRIQTALAYSSTGRLAHADIIVAGSATTESYVESMLSSAAGGPLAGAAERMHIVRAGVRERGRPVETFLRISVARTLRALTPGLDPPSDSP